MSSFEFLLDVIPSYPGQNIAIIEDSSDDFVEILADYSKKIEATLHIKTLGTREIQNSDKLRVKPFSFEQSKYNIFSINYDFLFLCVDISGREDIETIFKKIYRVMKNAGNIFVFVEKKDVSKYFKILENTNYVALNNIDFNETTDVIIAKKMHGWRKV